jgi:hypothetical protein
LVETIRSPKKTHQYAARSARTDCPLRRTGACDANRGIRPAQEVADNFRARGPCPRADPLTAGSSLAPLACSRDRQPYRLHALIPSRWQNAWTDNPLWTCRVTSSSKPAHFVLHDFPHRLLQFGDTRSVIFRSY